MGVLGMCVGCCCVLCEACHVTQMCVCVLVCSVCHVTFT